MSATIPPAFLFRFALPVARLDRLPRSGRRLLDLPAGCRLPFPSQLNGAAPFAEVRLAWNPQGLGIQAEIGGRQRNSRPRAESPENADGLDVWFDTRSTQTAHRASRFCHAFRLMPAGPNGTNDAPQPVAEALAIARAREDATPADARKIRLASSIDAAGWSLEAWIPGEILTGFDPETSPRLGFHMVARDSELGEQSLTVGRDFPVAHDPSLWCSLELKGYVATD